MVQVSTEVESRWFFYLRYTVYQKRYDVWGTFQTTRKLTVPVRIDKHNEKERTTLAIARSSYALSKRRKPLHWPDNTPFRILSIDGGGIKGIFPAAVLAEIEERYLSDESIANYFDLIVGTSTGGIIALGLGAGLTARDLRDLYHDRGREIFPAVNGLTNVAAMACRLLKYRYDHKILTQILSGLVGDKTLADSRNRLCIPSSEAEHGEVYVFKTPHHPDYHLDADEKMLKVALSTSAAPTFFKPLEDGGYKFVDGGIWANNPTMIGLIEALSAFDVRREQIRILSLGCGNRQFKANRWKVKLGGVLAWADVIFAAMHLQSITALGQAGLLIGNDRVSRIDAPMTGRPIGLDDWSRATNELMPAAEETVRKSGDGLVKAFFASPAQSFCPISTELRDDRTSLDYEN